MDLFNLNSKNSKIVNSKKLILMSILIALCTIIVTMLFNSSVQAYELVKPSEMTYVRWNTAKKGQVTVESYYEVNKDIKGLGDTMYSSEGREVSGNSLLATGMYFNYYNRIGDKIYIAVKGDINGDGKVSSTDLSIFKLVYVKSRKIEYIYEKAVDMNNDDKITATDLSQLKMMLVGMPLPEEVNPEKEDTMAPNPFEIKGTPTRTKITIEGETEDPTLDIIGKEITVEVDKYMYKLGESGEWQETNTFTGLKSDTEYKIYAKAIDKLGNERLASNNGTIVRTDKMPGIADHIKVELSEDGPTNKDITVDFKKDEELEGVHIEYKKGETGEEGTKGEQCETDENEDIYIRFVDDETGEAGEWVKIPVNNIDKEAPNEFEIETTPTTNSITVTTEDEVIDPDTKGAGENITGIKGYQYRLDDGELVPAEPTQDKSYTFQNLEQGSTHKVTMIAIDNAGNIREISKTVTVGTVEDSSQKIGKSWTPTNETKENVYVTFENNSTTEGLTLKYQINSQDENGWIDYDPTTPVEMTANGKVYAKLFDCIGQSNGVAEVVIDNIDKVAPEEFEYTTTQTTHSITVKGKTEDYASEGAREGIAGIKEYQVMLMDSKGTPLTEWITIPSEEIAEYTFTREEHGITQGKTYQISMQAIDKSGNITEASNKPKTVTVESLPKTNEHVTVEHNTQDPTNKPVTVTFKKDETVENMYIEYQVGGTDGEWIRGDEYTAEENETIYVRLVDETGQGEEGNWIEVKVDNIDKVVPNEFEIEGTSTTNSITVWTEDEVTDPEVEGAREEITGIKGYQYKLDNGEWEPAEPTQEKSYTFPNLEQGTTHTVTMRAIDNAGNTTEKTITIEVKEIETGETGIEYDLNPKEATPEARLTLSTTTEYKIEYAIGTNNNESYKEYPPVEGILITTNDPVYVRLKDETGQTGEPKRIEIDNIDNVNPTAFELKIIATTNSITVKGKTTDTANDGARDNIAGIKEYQFRLMDGEGAPLTDWVTLPELPSADQEAEYTFTREEHGITQGESYQVNMKVIDNAGNPTEASNKDSEDAKITIEEVEDSNANIVATKKPTEATNGPVEVTFTNKSTKEGLTLKYQKNSQEEDGWIDYDQTTPVEVTENGTVYARLYDSAGQYTGTAEVKIDNIDKIHPNPFPYQIVEITTNSITIKGKTEDTAGLGAGDNIAGIKGYQFQLKNNDGTEILGWTEPLTMPAEDGYAYYTFTREEHGITQGETYQVSMQAVDNAGNPTEANNETKTVTVERIETGEAGIEYDLNPKEATPEARLTLSTTTEYKIEYAIGADNNENYREYPPVEESGNTNNEENTNEGENSEGNQIQGIKITTNDPVYVRLKDETGQTGEPKRIEINNIDNVNPTAFELRVIPTTNSITVVGKTTDEANPGARDNIAGIKEYQFRLMNGEGEPQTDWITLPELPSADQEAEYTFTREEHGITQGRSYQVNMKAIDNAGNPTEASNKDSEDAKVTIEKVEDSETVIEKDWTPREATRGPVEVTFTNKSTKEGLTLKYQINSTNGEWLEYTEKIPMENNGKVYARLFDKAGQYTGTVTVDIQNIDKVYPDPFAYKDPEVTTHSITIKGKTEDHASEGAGLGIAGIKEYQFKLMDNEGNDITDWITLPSEEMPAEGEYAEYTFTREEYGIEQGKTYQVTMQAIDNAGNATEANNETKTVIVESLPKTSEHVTVEHSTKEPTNKPVTVTFQKDETVENMHIEYQVGGTDGEWIRGDECTVEENETIYVRLVDETGQGEEGNWIEVKIDNIDKVDPNSFTIEATSTTNSITVKTEDEVTDPEVEGAGENITGIKGYQYRLDEDGEWEPADPTQEKSHTFPNLQQGSTHTVYMKAIDKAGNETIIEKEITVKGMETGETGITYTKSTDDPTPSLILTLSTTTGHKIEYAIGADNNENYKAYPPVNEENNSTNDEGNNNNEQYSNVVATENVNNGENSNEGENSEGNQIEGIKITTNDPVYVRLKDETGQTGKAQEIKIDNIDNINPAAFKLSVISTTNSITVIGKTTDTANDGARPGIAGIKEYQYMLMDGEGNELTGWLTLPLEEMPVEGEDAEFIFTNEEHGVTQGETYKVNMQVIDKAGNLTEASNKESEDAKVTIERVENSETAIETDWTPKEATRGPVEVTFTNKSTKEGLTLKYQKNAQEEDGWIEYDPTTPIEMTENGIVYARLYDSAGQYTGTAKAEITNIDKVDPNPFPYEIVEKTTHSITIKGKTEDTADEKARPGIAGIKGYQFQLKNSEGTEIVRWTEPLTQPSEDGYAYYTFTREDHGIKQGESYQINMQAVDNAGNTTEASNKTDIVTVSSMPETKDHVTVEHSTKEPTNKPVTVTFKKDETVENMYIEYQVGGTDGEWIRGDQCTVEENETIYVRLVDETGQGEEGNWIPVTVDNIDKVDPNPFTIDTTSTTNSITVKTEDEVTDPEVEGAGENITGIKGYQYKLDEDGEWEPADPTQEKSHTFPNLKQGSTHTVYMKAIDKAGNETIIEKEVTVETIESGETGIQHDKSTDDPTQSLTLTLSTTTGLKIQYTKGEKEDESSWQDYTGEGILINTNTPVYARLKDNTGQTGTPKTIPIDNIDTVDPEPFDLTAKVTISKTEVKIYSIKVSGSTEDLVSDGARDGIAGIKGYQFQLKQEDGTPLTDWLPETPQKETSFDFTAEHGLEVGKSYKVTMRAVDNADNKKIASNKETGAEEDTEVFFSLIGMYVDYDAGKWTEEDLQLIRNSPGNTKVNNSIEVPNIQGQFGGFKVGDSKNSNATTVIHNGTAYAPRTSGWRVWSINESTGEVTLISAGNPETYCHKYVSGGNDGITSANILKKRDCSMYENKYAKEKSAKIITGQDAVDWYNENFPGNNYTLVENGGANSTFYDKMFTTVEPISVLENGSYYWLATMYNFDTLYRVGATGRRVLHTKENDARWGIRILVTLDASTFIDSSSTDGSEENPYRIYQKLKVTQSTTEPTKDNVIVTVETETNYTIQYQQEEGIWKNYTNDGITVEKNGEVKIRLIDESNENEVIGEETVVIDNIDKDKPIEFNIQTTSTTNSITVTADREITDPEVAGAMEGLTGIKGYQYQIDNEPLVPAEPTLTPNHTFEYLTQGTTHTVKMFAIDKVRNIREVSKENVLVNKIEDGETGIQHDKSTDDPTQSLTLTLSTTTGLKIQYTKGEKEDESSWQDYTGEAILINTNTPVYARLKDNTGQTGTPKTIPIDNIDTVAPKSFDLISKITIDKTELKPHSIKVSGNTEDLVSEGAREGIAGIKGYQFQLKQEDGTPLTDWLPETPKEETSFDFTAEHGLEVGKSYKVSMRAVDNADNTRTARNKETGAEEDTEVFFSLIGMYVDYNAGKWTEEDINKITNSPWNPTVKTSSLPTLAGQFGGFEVGKSKNESSTMLFKFIGDDKVPYEKPRTEGWRIWDISDIGEVTLISAGNTEAYCHATNFVGKGNSEKSVNILKNRDCSMYENNYAESDSAHILTGEEAVDWYNKQYETDYKIVKNGGYGEGAESTFYNKTFSTSEPISVLENATLYWMATVADTSDLYTVGPCYRCVSTNSGGTGPLGIRILVKLDASTFLDDKTTDGTENNPYHIYQKLKVTQSTEEPTKDNVKVTVETETNYTIQYQVEEGIWKNYTNEGITVEKNGEVKIRLIDENNENEVIGEETVTIDNIDKEKPIEFDIQTTSTTNSITVTADREITDPEVAGAMEGLTGIKGYQYQIDNEPLVPAEPTLTPSHTFNSLTQGTTHTVKMFAIDKVGNIREVTKENVLVKKIEDGETGIQHDKSTDDPTQSLTLTLSTTTGLKIQYTKGEKEDESSWQDYTGEGILINTNTPIYARLKDNIGQTGTPKTIPIDNIDTVAPKSFDLISKITIDKTELKPHSIKVSGNTEDLVSDGARDGIAGIKGYQFQLKQEDGTPLTEWLPKDQPQKETSFDFTAEHGLEVGKTYKVSMRAVDNADNQTPATNNDEEIFFSLIGKYVDYNAGKWTEEDFNKIKESPGGKTVNGTTELPTTQGQFGGFTLGQSRDTSSKQYRSADMITTDGSPNSEGWRIWDINENTGEITIISAGNPETYRHARGYSKESLNILRNRNCTMYENKYAKLKSAHIITGNEAADWYNEQYGTNYQIKDNGTNIQSTFYGVTFSSLEPISVLENGAFYWLASSYNSNFLYRIYPTMRVINHDYQNDISFRSTYPNYPRL